MTLSLVTAAVDFADLTVIDLSKASTPEGQAELVEQVRKALSEVGFFYVINHGYTPSQVWKRLLYFFQCLRFTSLDRRLAFSTSQA